MTGRRRRELADSFRLLASDEQWVLPGLLVGTIAFVAWVAGTVALAPQVASATGLPLELGDGEAPAAMAMALFGLLWLVVPALAVVLWLRSRMLNLRGNVEKYYRIEHPAVLLAFPTILLVVAAGVALALGHVPWYFTLALVPLSLFALMRTLAFSYRVYAFSHPLAVQTAVFVSTIAMLGGSLIGVGTATGRHGIAEAVLRTLGVPTRFAGPVAIGSITVPGPALATLLPVGLAVSYVLVQSAVSLVVHLTEPEVDRSKMRTGQRYPPFLSTTPNAQTPVRPSDSGGGSAHSDPTGSAAPADEEPGVSVSDGPADDSDDPDDDLDDVSNTRVFTPPSGDSDGDIGPKSADGGVGETRPGPAADDGEPGPLANGQVSCHACGETFTDDTAIRFCPHCGAAIDHE